MNGAGRYAPSPTSDLHLGNLRTALLAWLFARSTDRAFLLRIEDLDPQRAADRGIAARQQADLAAIGLEFDHPVMVQSRRGAAYAEALERIAEHTYECFCTRREIADAASAPHSISGRTYPGTCRNLSEAERAVRRRVRPAALRVRASGASQTITDLLHGPYTAVMDDFVVQRNDGVPAYNLAVVVDDAAQGVDQVVRGDDLLSSAPRQAWLAGLLGATVPSYAHVPLALNTDGVRLAKRDGAVSLGALAERGISAQQALGWMAGSLRLTERGEQVSPHQLLERFDPARLPRTPWVVAP